MEEHFVNYNQALALKELGFDEPCIARYIIPGDLVFKGCYEDSNIIHLELTQNDICEAHVLAPLKSQVFKWFRDEYKWYAEINLDSYKEPYSLKVTIKKMDVTNTYVEKEFYPYANGIGAIDNDKYEEAESECIDRLISIIKEKK